MKVTLWGTRGSLASPGPETARYGGNTCCVQVENARGQVLVLDAGTGIRRLGAALPPDLARVDLLLTHLHMDHLQGLGFFKPLRTPGKEVHIWGPASMLLGLRARLVRYLSPPLFPVLLRDVECDLTLHEVPRDEIRIDGFEVSAALICHPDPTLGYRIIADGHTLTYMPDHEPALGARHFPLSPDWVSGSDLARGVDLLIHDAQYTPEEYAGRIGWGHSSMPQTVAFAQQAGARELVPFHHDPSHTDDDLDRLFAELRAQTPPPLRITPGKEGMSFDLS